MDWKERRERSRSALALKELERGQVYVSQIIEWEEEYRCGKKTFSRICNSLSSQGENVRPLLLRPISEDSGVIFYECLSGAIAILPKKSTHNKSSQQERAMRLLDRIGSWFDRKPTIEISFHDGPPLPPDEEDKAIAARMDAEIERTSEQKAVCRFCQHWDSIPDCPGSEGWDEDEYLFDVWKGGDCSAFEGLSCDRSFLLDEYDYEEDEE